MIYHVADDQKLAPYPAVRDVGGAFPQPAVHTPAVSHGAHRPRIHVAEGDDTTLRALRADSLPLHVAPVELPENMGETVCRYLRGEISIREAAEVTGVSKTTFWRNVRSVS